ncbi:hypothetical protein [Corallibacter sp.]
MKIIKTFVGLFKKLNTLKEWFSFISILGEVIDFAVKKFDEFEKTIE